MHSLCRELFEPAVLACNTEARTSICLCSLKSPKKNAMGYSHSCIMYAGVEPAVLNGGAVLCHPEWPVPLASRIIARLLVLDVSRPILRGQQVLLTVWCLALGSFELMFAMLYLSLHDACWCP